MTTAETATAAAFPNTVSTRLSWAMRVLGAVAMLLAKWAFIGDGQDRTKNPDAWWRKIEQAIESPDVDVDLENNTAGTAAPAPLPANTASKIDVIVEAPDIPAPAPAPVPAPIPAKTPALAPVPPVPALQPAAPRAPFCMPYHPPQTNFGRLGFSYCDSWASDNGDMVTSALSSSKSDALAGCKYIPVRCVGSAGTAGTAGTAGHTAGSSVAFAAFAAPATSAKTSADSAAKPGVKPAPTPMFSACAAPNAGAMQSPMAVLPGAGFPFSGFPTATIDPWDDTTADLPAV